MRVFVPVWLGLAAMAIGGTALAQPADPPPPPASPKGPPAAPHPAEQPPVPPPPGAVVQVNDPPPALPPVFPSEAPTNGPSIAGWHGAPYLRDPHDYFRVFPRALIHLDTTGFVGPGVSKLTLGDGSAALKTRFVFRRLRVELSGQFLKRWTFTANFDISQTLTNVAGTAQLAASKPGQAPTSDTATYEPADGASGVFNPANIFINYSVGPWLNFQLGQGNANFSMESRTPIRITPFLERMMPIRSFVLSSDKEMGLTVWGDAWGGRLTYDVGVYSGDGRNRPAVDNRVDFMGRVVGRPFTGDFADVQIGLSAKHGDRDPASVTYDYPAITTGGGFALWNPTYKDTSGRRTHVIPSGAQNAIGGELRFAVKMIDIRGEAYYVANNTREAIEGYQATNTERLGQVSGVGWYGLISIWPLGERVDLGNRPGMFRPLIPDFSKEPPRPTYGLEVLAAVGGVNARYDGASRGGAYDPNTPGAPRADGTDPRRNITAYQYIFGINYWHAAWWSIIRLTFNYSVYHTPGSGTEKNLAVVPGNLGAEPTQGAHLLHEFSGRVGLQF